ncbi:DUF1810 domain-containing protein [Pararhizobium sp. YC-54]|uniref:DUF1810 domain-containing protein n=1 Tax=Pararhizobium sp. YC-54 TaxID=2986920 RepID=UPI0021F740BD|nr:DUF1810 domain-containing protein [Pararhizobium sp. YC-54]MCV9998994.1 DUF1810 domain-containing protein [Pararhizobium sp. YC-54]
MSDPYHLSRFVEAQEAVYETALRELEHGRKQSHWMWFIFPQLAGLGHSPIALQFGISGLDEAHAYLAHPLLGVRLVKCTRAINAVRNRTAHQIFGSPDDLKLRSSMTLFRETANDPEPFRTAIERYFGGEADARTLEILAKR